MAQGRAIVPWGRSLQSGRWQLIDVLVRGAGAVGLARALALSRQGLAVALLGARGARRPAPTCAPMR